MPPRWGYWTITEVSQKVIDEPCVHIIHENDDWAAPLRAALGSIGASYRDWNLSQGCFALDEAPPPGVFFNRMSASAHSRDHRYAPEYAACVLAWLESHRRRVINPGRVLQLELSKVAQYTALNAHGIRTPATVAALGREQLIVAARRFKDPFICKHNRAGKGLGVRLLPDVQALQNYLPGPDYQPSVDGVLLLQEYIQAPEPIITRVEFVGRELLYAVRVDTSEGFELCPADVCSLDGDFCATGEQAKARFNIMTDFAHPLVERYRRFMEQWGIDVASFEFIVDHQGLDYTYDINTNTNYNSAAEQRAGVSGMMRMATYLLQELSRIDRVESAV